MKLFDVIKYEGDNSIFVWKHPCEDFNMLTQLVVHEGQEAIFFLNGQSLDSFGPGRYTLKAKNIPIIKKTLNFAAGGIPPFQCEVYFINKSCQMAMKWGTDSRVQFIEPKYNFPLSIGVSGEMCLSVSDSRKLLEKLVGTQKYLSREKLTELVRSFLMAKVKTYIAQSIKSESINIFEIDEHLSKFSDSIKNLLVSDFEEYGLNLEKFYVTKVLKPDGEAQYEKYKELYFRQYADITEAKINQQKEVINAETEAQKVVIASKAQAVKRSQEGYTYSQERIFDVAEKAAENNTSGGFVNMGVGIGAMAGVSSTVGKMMGTVMSDAAESVTKPSASPSAQADKFCENCGAPIAEGAAFCEECGKPIVTLGVCKKCGYKFERTGKFCPKCGTKRED